MIRREHEGVCWLQFENLTEFSRLKHGVFLRKGGVSGGSFESLNLGARVGDDTACVMKNMERVSDILGSERLVSLEQCHGERVIEAEMDGLKADGIVTDTFGVGLMINHADCQAAIIYDPIKHVVGNIHAGWRGSVLNIYANAIEQMRERFGCDPANLFVGISPSLGPQSAEFVSFAEELPETFLNFQVKPNYFDFWQISRWQLEQCGVLPDHIEIAGICTYRNEDYFSYRREKTTGRHGTVALLR